LFQLAIVSKKTWVKRIVIEKTWVQRSLHTDRTIIILTVLLGSESTLENQSMEESNGETSKFKE
jgi:hypothetical protein